MVVIAVSLSNFALGGAVTKANPESGATLFGANRVRVAITADIVIKMIGIILAVLVYPPCAMFGILIAGIVVTFLSVNQK